MKKLNKKQAARENGAKGGRKARAEPTAEPGGGVQADEPAATATPAPATVTQEAAAADTLEAADDMADERNAAALTEEGAPEASATSTTSSPLPLDLAEEEETRAAYAREVARGIRKGREEARAAYVAKWHEEEDEYDTRWHEAMENERERDKEREAAWERKTERERERKKENRRARHMMPNGIV